MSLLTPCPARHDPADQQHDADTDNLEAAQDELEADAKVLCQRRYVVLQHGLGCDQLAGDPAEQSSTGPHQDWISRQQTHDQGGAGDHQWDRDDEPRDYQPDALVGGRSLSRAGNSEHVVEAHDDICNGDDLDGFPEAATARNLVLAGLLVAGQKLDGDPEEQQAARQLQPGHVEQELHQHGEDNAQNDGSAGAEQDADAALARRQIAAGKGDHDGIVARQDNIDADDLDDGDGGQGVIAKQRSEPIQPLLGG